MAKNSAGTITIDVKVDLSVFREPTAKQLNDEIACGLSVAEDLLESFWVIPR